MFQASRLASDGEHLCIVTELMGSNLKALQKTYHTSLPRPLAKHILRQILKGLVQY